MPKVVDAQLWIAMEGLDLDSKHYIIAAKTFKEAVAAAPDGVVAISPHSFSRGAGTPITGQVALIIAEKD